MNRLIHNIIYFNKIADKKNLLFLFLFLLSGLTLFGWDFENSEYNIQLTISDSWSRMEDMEKQINSCLLSLFNIDTAGSFNLIVVDDSLEKRFEALSEEEQQTLMENSLIDTTNVLETQLSVTMNKQYLKKIDGRYYGVFEYKLDGINVIQAVAYSGTIQYIYTMAGVGGKPNDLFFDIVNNVKYLN